MILRGNRAFTISYQKPMVKIDNIPVYDAILDGKDTGMLRISLVDAPAVMSDFQAFDLQRPLQLYRVEDEEQRRVLGVVMRADFPIYRRDAQNGEYYIIYKAATIKEIAEKYLLESRQNAVNLQHVEGSDVEGVNMVQFFIKGDGIAPEGFEEIADGSLFAEFHVTNDEVWAAIKDGTYKGFSLEGYFVLTPETDAKGVADIVDDLDGRFAALLRDFPAIIKSNDMTNLKQFFKALGEAIASMPDPAPAKQEFKSVPTDQGILSWDGDDELPAVGAAVYVEDEEGNRGEAPEGEYTFEDGTVVVVADGKVSEIREPAAAPESEQEVSAAALHRLVAQKFGQSFDEKYAAIYAALFDKGYEDIWIVEAGDDFAVIEEWDEDGRKYFRFPVTFNEDGSASVGDAVEVKHQFVPIDAPDPFEEARAASENLAAVRSELEEVRAELAAVKAQPAGAPAHEAFKNVGGKDTAAPQGLRGSAGLQNLARVINSK